jgi:exoribonuclease II
MTTRKTQKRRLERAGFVHVAEWLPAAYAARVVAQAETYRADVQAVLDEPVRPRGRPRKSS